MSEAVFFEYADASGMSRRTRDKTGAIAASGNNREGSPVELDPVGSSIGISSPYVAAANTSSFGINPQYPMLQDVFSDSPFFTGGGGGFGGGGGGSYATLDGVSVPYWFAISALQNGSAVQCPNNNCGPRVYSVNGQNVLSSPFQAYADGTSGYNVPIWGNTSVNVLPENGDAPPPLVNPANDRIIGWRFQAFGSDSSFWNISLQNGRHTRLQDEPTQQEKLDDAITAIKKILEGANECSKYFGAKASSAFEDLANKLVLGEVDSDSTGISMSLLFNQILLLLNEKNIQFYGSQKNKTNPVYWHTVPITAVINNSSSGLFFSNSSYKGFNGVKKRVLQILHELGHITITGFTSEGVNKSLKKTGGYKEKPLLEVDGGNSGLSSANTDKVLKHCREQIEGL